MVVILAIDFDGTIVEDHFPEIGNFKPGAKENLLRLKKDGYYLILWTNRNGKKLAEAAQFLGENGVLFDSYNNGCPANIAEYGGIDTRKVFHDMVIDDRGLLKPLPHWDEIYEMIIDRVPLTREDKVIREGHL